MADWMDWLEGISGAAGGIAKGWTEGMKPLAAWEDVRKSDLANDRYEYGNQDAQYQQLARMGEQVPAWYSDQRDLAQTGFQEGTAQNRYDIFGIEQKTSLAQMLTDPNGAFQMGLRQDNVQPGTPEHSRRVLELIGQHDVTGLQGNAAYNTLGVRAGDQRALNDQATISLVENALQRRMGDLELKVFKGDDGNLYMNRGGAVMKIEDPDALLRAATLSAGATPGAAINQEVKFLGEVGLNNANMFQRYNQTGQGGKEVQTALTQIGTRANQRVTDTRMAVENIKKEDRYKFATPDEQKEMLASAERDYAEAQATMQRVTRAWEQVAAGQPITGVGGGGGRPGAGTPPPGAGTPPPGTPPPSGAKPSAASVMTGQASLNAPRMMPGTQAEQLTDEQAAMEQYAIMMGLPMPGKTPFVGPPTSASMQGGATGSWDAPATPAAPAGPTAGVPQGRSPYSGVASFPAPSDPTGGPILNFNPNSFTPGGGIFQSPWQPAPTSAVSQMSPQQLIAYLQRLAPNIQSQNRGPQGGGGGINMQQLMAMLQQRGMMG